MATGREMQLTGRIGEYLVAAELMKNGFFATTFSGNVPDFDIVVISKDFKGIPIQVKTIRKGDWQFSDARKFIRISFSGGKQKVVGKAKTKDLIVVLVKLDQDGDDFYVLEWKNLQDAIYKGYKEYLDRKKGVKTKNPESYHCIIYPKDLIPYKAKGNWPLIEKKLKGKEGGK